MITVEFTGASGAGKSFLVNAVSRELRSRGIETNEPLGLLVGRFSNKISQERLRVALLDFIVLPWSIAGSLANPRYIFHCWSSIRKSGVSFPRSLLLFRSILRKIGVWYYSQRLSKEAGCLLVDEGTFHSAHVIFLNGGMFPDNHDIEKFCEITPLSDKLVILMADEETLQKRVLGRNDKPISGVDNSFLCQFVKNANQLFKQLLCELEDKSSVRCIDMSHSGQENLELKAKEIADWIQLEQ